MKAVFILLMVFTFQLKAQDSLVIDEENSLPFSNTRPLEICHTILGINSNQSLFFAEPKRPIFEYLNKILLRYRYRAISIRLNASYFNRTTSKENSYSYNEPDFGMSTVTDYKLGIGLQYSFFKKQEYLYSFLDLNYVKRVQKSSINNFITNYYSNLASKLYGINMCFGLGSKIKIVQNLYISPEIGYDYSHLEGKTKNTGFQIVPQEPKFEKQVYGNLSTKIQMSFIFKAH
ncbi:MAG: hypothetical protein KAZ71_00670 [Bacteroidia bacterium]|nr:hypothetical protein [Bacteroidia bacterium]